MVLHDYECPSGHVTEHFVSADKTTVRCPVCRKRAERVFLPRRQRNAEPPPTVYFINKAGERQWPWRDDQTPPKGFDRVEVHAHEIRRFERQMNREERERSRAAREKQLERYKAAQKIKHDSLRNDMRGMPDAYRELALYAMQQEDAGYSRNYDPEFHIGAYS